MPDIQDRIHELLRQAGHSMPAMQILQIALNICSPNQLAAEKVLRGILGNDARFCSRKGQWFLKLSSASAGSSLQARAAFLCVQQARRSSALAPMRGALYLPARDFAWVYDSAIPTAIRSHDHLIPQDGILVFWRGRELQLWNRCMEELGMDIWCGETISLGNLAAIVLDRPFSKLELDDLASLLEIAAPDAEEPESVARFYHRLFTGLIERSPAEVQSSSERLKKWMIAATPKIDYSTLAFNRQFLERLPESAGVYIMKDRRGHTIYVGKSRNLKRRVRSYFAPRAISNPKCAKIHRQLYSLEICQTPNEIEALLLEMRLIRDFRPSINLQSEVHERPSKYAKKMNIILLSARPGGERADVYFLVRGLFSGQMSAKLGAAAPAGMLSKIKSLFFVHRKPRGVKRQPWQTELVARWLSSNRHRLNWVDVDDAGDYESTAGRLDSYLKDPEKLSLKVHYR